MLELAILGLLKEQDLHGYELKKRLSDTLGSGSAVSFGSLYPALGRLERAGAVRSLEPPLDAPPIPQTGSLGGELAAFRARGAGGRRGRSRKVYRITARGEELFVELLADEGGPAEDARLFTLRLAFARYLSDDARLGMLEHRRFQLVERLNRSGARARTTKDKLDAYLHSLLEHDREATEHDLSWIERLIAREREARAASAAVGGTDRDTSVAGPSPDVPDRLGPPGEHAPTTTTTTPTMTTLTTTTPVAVTTGSDKESTR
ncbi:MAG: PadR family transcriptional regulator [Acidimicrobiales bacterium]